MKLCIYEIEYERLRDMTTEVFFKVASARASGFSVIRFDIKNQNEAVKIKTVNFLTRILRGMKKRSAVQFFVTEEGFARSSTEAQYLLNVFPEVEAALDVPSEQKTVFVRI